MEKTNSKQVLLFYCVESEDLARKVAAASQSIQLQSINWRPISVNIRKQLYKRLEDATCKKMHLHDVYKDMKRQKVGGSNFGSRSKLERVEGWSSSVKKRRSRSGFTFTIVS